MSVGSSFISHEGALRLTMISNLFKTYPFKIKISDGLIKFEDNSLCNLETKFLVRHRMLENENLRKKYFIFRAKNISNTLNTETNSTFISFCSEINGILIKYLENKEHWYSPSISKDRTLFLVNLIQMIENILGQRNLKDVISDLRGVIYILKLIKDQEIWYNRSIPNLGHSFLKLCNYKDKIHISHILDLIRNELGFLLINKIIEFKTQPVSIQLDELKIISVDTLNTIFNCFNDDLIKYCNIDDNIDLKKDVFKSKFLNDLIEIKNHVFYLKSIELYDTLVTKDHSNFFGKMLHKNQDLKKVEDKFAIYFRSNDNTVYMVIYLKIRERFYNKIDQKNLLNSVSFYKKMIFHYLLIDLFFIYKIQFLINKMEQHLGSLNVEDQKKYFAPRLFKGNKSIEEKFLNNLVNSKIYQLNEIPIEKMIFSQNIQMSSDGNYLNPSKDPLIYENLKKELEEWKTKIDSFTYDYCSEKNKLVMINLKKLSLKFGNILNGIEQLNTIILARQVFLKFSSKQENVINGMYDKCSKLIEFYSKNEDTSLFISNIWKELCDNQADFNQIHLLDHAKIDDLKKRIKAL